MTGADLSGAELNLSPHLILSLSLHQDSIKKGKDWIMSHPESASAIAAFVCARLEASPEFSPKLNMIYLVNDVLHHRSDLVSLTVPLPSSPSPSA